VQGSSSQHGFLNLFLSYFSGVLDYLIGRTVGHRSFSEICVRKASLGIKYFHEFELQIYIPRITLQISGADTF
jgi:hypothetical protein